jgi:hypothetical protein
MLPPAATMDAARWLENRAYGNSLRAVEVADIERDPVWLFDRLANS